MSAMETLLDYLPGASVSLDHQADEVLTARLEMIADHYQARRRRSPREGEVPYRPLPPAAAVPGPRRLGRACWPLGRCSAFTPFAKPDGAGGVEAAAGPGPVFAEARAAGRNVFDAYAHAQATCESRAGGRSSPPGPAARASGWPTCCARTGSRRSRWTTGGRPPQARRAPSALVVLGLERGFVADRPRRWSSASRTCWASASPGRRAGASGPTSSSPRPTGIERGRPGGAPGPRHRPLRRAGDAAGHRRAA